MTIQVQEGWDWLGGASSINAAISSRGWSVINRTPSIVTGRFGFGYAARVSSSGSLSNATKFWGPVKPLKDGPTDEGLIGAGIYRDSSDTSSNGPSLVFWDTLDNNIQITISFEAYGIVRVRRGSAGTLIGTSDPGQFYNKVWFNVEVKAKIDNTNGEVEVRINGKTVLHLVSVDTQGTTQATFSAAGCGVTDIPGEEVTGWIDDFYCLDMLGSTNNDWLGTNRIKSQFVIADGSHIDSIIGGTSPAATHWQSVQNVNLDDTKFVYIPYTDVGDYDLYDMNPNAAATIVHAVQVTVGARQDDATQLVIQTAIKSGSTVGYSADIHLSQSYRFYDEFYETNPDTGVGWTDTEVNGIEVGFKLEAVL